MPKETPTYCRRKADQCWEMAGLASRDGDKKDAARYTKEAREWESKAEGENHA